MSDDIEVVESSRLRPPQMPQRPRLIEHLAGELGDSDFRRGPSPIDRFESYRLHKITFVLMVLLPVLAPVLIAATRAFEAALADSSNQGWPWLNVLLVFALIYLAVGLLAFGSLLEES